MRPTSRVASVATAMPHAAPRAALSSAALGSVFYACAAHWAMQFYACLRSIWDGKSTLLWVVPSYTTPFETCFFDVFSWCRCWYSYHQVAALSSTWLSKGKLRGKSFRDQAPHARFLDCDSPWPIAMGSFTIWRTFDHPLHFPQFPDLLWYALNVWPLST